MTNEETNHCIDAMWRKHYKVHWKISFTKISREVNQIRERRKVNQQTHLSGVVDKKMEEAYKVTLTMLNKT